MKSVITITVTRQKCRYLKIGKAKRKTFDNNERSFIDVASTMIRELEDFVSNARPKGAYNIGEPLE
jgi:hypothetical protein